MCAIFSVKLKNKMQSVIQPIEIESDPDSQETIDVDWPKSSFISIESASKNDETNKNR